MKELFEDQKNLAKRQMVVVSEWGLAFQVVFALPALAYLVWHYPRLISKSHKPHPRRKWFLLLTVMIAYITIISLEGPLSKATFDDLSKRSHKDQLTTPNVLRIQETVFVTSVCMCLFLVGVSVEQNIKNIEETKNKITNCKTAIEASSELLEDHTHLKKGLSPLLFLLIIPTAVGNISMLYMSMNWWNCRVWFVVFSTILSYTCIIIEDSYLAIKSVTHAIR